MSMIKAGFFVALMAIAGGGAAMAVQPAQAAAPCELNACVTSTGNCDMTDIPANCRETTGGCQSSPC